MNEEYSIKEDLLGRKFWLVFTVIIAVEMLCVFLAPYLFTHLSLAYDLTGPERGTIGDAIGGTTAPIIGFFGSLLVFLSLYAQIRANRIIVNQFEEERVRYKDESIQRQKDKLEGQNNELFQTVLNGIQMQNQELMDLSAYNSGGREVRGVNAARQILLKIRRDLFSWEYLIIESIVRALDEGLEIVEQFSLQRQQKIIVANQTLIVVQKLEIALGEVNPTQLVPDSSLKDFYDMLSGINEKIARLRVEDPVAPDSV